MQINNGGGPPPYPLAAPNGTNSAPSYAFASATNTGFYTDGTNVFITLAGAQTYSFGPTQLQLVNSAATLAFTSDTVFARPAAGVFAPNADGGVSLGNTNKRYNNIVGTAFQAFNAAGDTQAAMTLGNTTLTFGAGGSAAADVSVGRTTTNAWGRLQYSPSGTLTGSPADLHVFDIIPVVAGAFTVTRLNYLNLQQPTGAATITDAAAMRFDAAVGTHKALASSAAVAVTLGSTGPTGSTAGGPQGWLKLNINGTLRYTPFW